MHNRGEIMSNITVLRIDQQSNAPQIIGDYVDPIQKRSQKADPIKDIDLIAEVSETFIRSKKYRNNLLFLLGCNCGLRCGEILSLKWGQLLAADGAIRKTIEFIEEKNSKKDQNGEFVAVKSREVYVNEAVREAISLFMQSKSTVNRGDYVFKSESNSASYYSKRRAEGHGLKHDHLTVQSVNRILRKMFRETLDIVDLHVSSHSMRKTFARQILDNCPEGHYHDTLRFLQMMLGHAKIESTLHYIGITDEEVEKAFLDLNLGKARTSQSGRTAEIIPFSKIQNNVKEML